METSASYEARSAPLSYSTGHRGAGMLRAGLTAPRCGKALSERLALKPYWENPPYGILEGAMETSASYEARSAPSSYSTATALMQWTRAAALHNRHAIQVRSGT